jgi:transposase
MENRIIIALLIGASVASVYAFDGYSDYLSYDALNPLQETRARKKAERQSAVKDYTELLKQARLRGYKLEKRKHALPRPERKKQKELSRLGDKLSDLDTQIDDLDKQIENLKKRQYKAQIYGLPGYERFFTGEITGPVSTFPSTTKGFKSWFARKWYGK